MARILFNVLFPDNAGNPTQSSLCSATDGVVNKTDLHLTIKIDGEVLAQTIPGINDANVFTGFGAAVNLVTATGINSTFWFDDAVHNKFYLDAVFPYNSKDLWRSYDLYIKIEKLGYLVYENTFKIYNYDYGNSPTQVDFEGFFINYNPDFDFYLIDEALEGNVTGGVQTRPYGKFTAYRKPFSSLIHIYNMSATQSTVEYSDSGGSSSTVLNTTICNGEYCTITGVYTTGSDTCTKTVIVKKEQYFPNWDITTSCVNCSTDCTNILADNTATPNIDLTSMTVQHQTGYRVYPALNFTLEYELYDKDGALVDSYKSHIQLGSYPTSINPIDYAWVNFTTPTAGAYFLRTRLILYGINTDGVQLNNGGLTFDSWYIITEDDGATADFSPIGATSSGYGAVFVYKTAGSPFWGNNTLATVMVLDQYVVNCLYTNILNSCNYGEVTQIACGKYKICNYSTEDLTYAVYKVKDSTSFETTAIFSGTLSPLADAPDNCIEITFDGDGAYKIVLTPTGSLEQVPPINYVLVVYCDLLACWHRYINYLVCNADPCCDTCPKDYYKTYHDFFGLMVHSHTFFALISGLYTSSYYYTSLAPGVISDLYEVQTLIDRFKLYCTDCEDNCCN